ncbi:MAG: type VI secretion system tube protein Hcp [Phycisphaeraceae bacterium]|nr:type VI secretion system tube protein Hcp [Phycisphaeraceae bacterium]
MVRHKRVLVTVLGVGSVVAAAWVFAGPINPPGGAVTSTGKTTQEIYDAVQGVGTTVTGAGRLVGVPGANTSAGTLDLPAIGPFPKSTTPIVGLVFDMSYQANTGGGGVGGTVVFNEFSVVRDLDETSVAPFRAMTTGMHLQSITVKLTNASGPITYKLSDALVIRDSVKLVQRADGTFAQLETTQFMGTQVDVTTVLGTASYSAGGHAAQP